MMDSVLQDLKFAARTLRRSPVFALVAISTLALGIGANTAIFTVVNAVLLRPLPIEHSERVYAIGEPSARASGWTSVTSAYNLFTWKRSATTMRVAGFWSSSGNVTGRGEPRALNGTVAAGGLFEVLALPTRQGRGLIAADEEPASAPVIVLSDETARDLFGTSASVVGETVTLNGTARTVVGVMPARYAFLGERSAFFVPSQLDAVARQNRDQGYIVAIARLNSGVTIQRARAELATLAERMRRENPIEDGNARLLALPLRDMIVGDARTQLLVLLSAVAVVLLITCANLANLLLARGHARRAEMAVRQALGADQSRIARQLLTESLVLSLLGGGLGLLVGSMFLRVLMAAQAATNLPRAGEVGLDGRVLGFTLAVSLGAGLIFGGVPAWKLSRGRSGEVLRESTKASSSGGVARSALIVSELALAMMLLVSAGLLIRTFDMLRRVNPGVRTDHVLTFTVRLPDRKPAFFPSAVERIRVLPGVTAAGVTSQLPLLGRGIAAGFLRADRASLPGSPVGIESYRVVTPEYFNAIGLPLRRGRLLTSADRLDAPAVVINEELAKRYFPDEEPLGKAVYLGSVNDPIVPRGIIVGIVSDTRDAGLGVGAPPLLYVPLALIPTWPMMSFAVRTNGDPTLLLATIRGVIREMDPRVPLRDVRTLDDVLSSATAPARWSSTLLTIFAVVALSIAVLGVFGVLSFVVTQRTRELGIRIALGAAPGQVRRMVVGYGVRLAFLGLVLGTLGARWATKFLGNLLYGVSATDVATFIVVAAVLLAAVVVASYLPARRATRVDPAMALRAE